jgi:two-component system, NtrC family, sensor kinase
MWIVPMRMRDGSRPWQFRLGYYTTAIRAQLRSTILTNALIGVGLAILFIGTSLIVTHRMLRRLNSLTRAVAELERGKLEVSLPEAGNDEIGRLVAGFTAMVHSIRERDAKIQEQLESLEAARAELESRVELRTRELQASQAQLIAASRRAGMAEVASNVLHNVGNVLNSVNVSATLLEQRLTSSRMIQVSKVSALIHEHEHDLGDYLRADPRGKLIPQYLADLGTSLQQERTSMLDEVQSLTRAIDHIKRIVVTQQSYAKCDIDIDIDIGEILALDVVMEDAVRISASGTTETTAIAREYSPTPQLKLDRHKIVHILVNLINNAKQAVAELGPPAQIRLCIAMDGEHAVRVDVIDNGVGIAQANLTRIFNHGFTTKPDGHGFGLHSAALSAQEMGGSLNAHSDGEGLGARFSLVLPVNRAGDLRLAGK